jgi:hypothetical protein
MKIFRSNLILGLLLFFVSNCACQNDSLNQKLFDNNSSVLKFETEFHDFGTIKKGEVITYNFKFRNTGSQPLIISDVNTSCDCTTPEWSREPIKSGDSSIIKITYKSEEEGGDQAKEIKVYNNSNIPIKILRFTGYVDYSSK